jgi:hypothetical protein
MHVGKSGDAAGPGLRLRFGLRALLVFVALVALALVGGRQWMQLRNAHFEYGRTWAAWKADRVVADDVELAAKNLYDREAATVWIGRSVATRRQAERLRDFADSLEARTYTTTYGSADGVERDRKHVEVLRRKAAELAL